MPRHLLRALVALVCCHGSLAGSISPAPTALRRPSTKARSNTGASTTAPGILPCPKLSIVILVVGTRGDVQPFLALGAKLKAEGHRVRLATHADFRGMVTKSGLEYYPLAGDSKSLAKWMVQTGGRIMPNVLIKEERATIAPKIKMLREITHSTWPACTEPDPEDEHQTPFKADAIISNPVSYGHIHCAEALNVPLHLMFPQVGRGATSCRLFVWPLFHCPRSHCATTRPDQLTHFAFALPNSDFCALICHLWLVAAAVVPDHRLPAPNVDDHQLHERLGRRRLETHACT